MGRTVRCAVALLLALGGASACGGAVACGGAAACGAGELALPDTAGCVRLGGVARSEAGGAARRIAPPGPDGGRSAGLRAGIRAGARADLDARLPTAAGPLRAYLGVATGGYGRR